MLLPLNEFDPFSNALSNTSNINLERKYRYTRGQFKNTFEALRKLGIARPHEQFEDVASDDPRERRRGRRQIASRYTLEATPDGSPWMCSWRGKRKPTPRPRVGKLLFTPAEDTEIQGLVRGRRGVL
jgi:hypothetical protein